MPITTLRVEPGVYLGKWTGNVTLEEIYASRDEVSRLARMDHIAQHVVIIDGQNGKTVPLDVRTMRNATPDDRLLTLVINAPMIGKVLGRMVVQATKMPLEFHNSLDEAVTRAREVLRDSGIVP